MVIDQAGGRSGPRTATFGGQRLYVFDDDKNMVFILDKGVMRKAGKNQSFGGGWPRMVDQGKVSRQGIGLNPKLWMKTWKSAKKGYTFYVYDKKQDVFYELTDIEIIHDHAHLEKGFDKPLYLTPLDAYTERSKVNIPDRVKKASSRRT